MFGCQKYHQYIYSKTTTVLTDHKPLEFLFKKPLSCAPPRLQRMLLHLQKYDLNVEYRPGTSLVIADTLSRAPSKETEMEDQDLFQVHTITYLPVSMEKLAEFCVETGKGKALQKLKETVINGWPEHKQDVDLSIREYWSMRDEINLQDGLLLKGVRLIVPTLLRPEMLKKIHENHLGIEKCKKRARDVLYWPGMNGQITELVTSCCTCLQFRNAQRKEGKKSAWTCSNLTATISSSLLTTTQSSSRL